MRHFGRSHEGCGGRGSFFRSLWLAKMRHGHGGAGPFRGGFGGGFGGGGFGGGDDFSRGRKFSSEDLQVLLLALLVEEPRHGYELIKLLETRSNGFYTPSPGMVYPALTYLEEIGYATVTSEGNRKRYALTDEGRAYVETNRDRVDYIWSKLNFFAQKMGMVRRALAGEAEDERGGTNPLRALMEARGKLKHLLMSRINASAEEQSRIAQILDRASAEIEAQPEQPRGSVGENPQVPGAQPPGSAKGGDL